MVDQRTDTCSPPPEGGRVREGGHKRASPRRWAAESASRNARRLRREMTDIERALWARLRGKQLDGYRFRKQVPLGRFIADFACMQPKLIIEVDGGHHADSVDHDAERTEWLRSQDFAVLRFWNNEVSENMDGVLQVVIDKLHELNADV